MTPQTRQAKELWGPAHVAMLLRRWIFFLLLNSVGCGIFLLGRVVRLNVMVEIFFILKSSIASFTGERVALSVPFLVFLSKTNCVEHDVAK